MVHRQHLAIAAGVAALGAAGLGLADARVLGDEVPLAAADLDAIALQVLAANPQLASSPGIRFAYAQRSVRDTDIADVIFEPHRESAGIREAYQVGCWRPADSPAWTCNPAEIRRYVALSTQDFEVRVTGPLDFDETLAVIEATRQTLTLAPDTQATALMVVPCDGGYRVHWRMDEADVHKLAMALDMQDLAQPDAWSVTDFLFDVVPSQ